MRIFVSRFIFLISESKPNGLSHHYAHPPSHQTGFGGHRSNSFDLGSGLGAPPGAVNKHRNRLSALGRLFKPWKWKRRKKSEKFEKTSKCKFDKKNGTRLDVNSKTSFSAIINLF